MNLAIAIVVGLLVGAVGFIPTIKLSTRMRRMMAEKNGVGSVGLLLLSLAVSFLIMLIAILICQSGKGCAVAFRFGPSCWSERYGNCFWHQSE